MKEDGKGSDRGRINVDEKETQKGWKAIKSVSEQNEGYVISLVRNHHSDLFTPLMTSHGFCFTLL